jgi:TetR/AcrR family transcriptional repressor of mexJK operon
MNERSFVSGTPNKIISAAYAEFLECGYHGATMRQIARRCEMAPGSLYNHFRGKEILFTAVFAAHQPYQILIPALESAQGNTLEALVRDAARRMIAAIENHAGLVKLMFIEIVEFQGVHIQEVYLQALPQLSAFIQQMAAASGALRSIPLISVLRAFIGLFYSHFMAELIAGGKLSPQEHEQLLSDQVDIFLHGIMA